MKLKSVEYYEHKLAEAEKRVALINDILSEDSKVVRWKRNADMLRAERFRLIDDMKGYKCIIAHLESGIDISRYQNKEHAKRIINRERPMGRRVDK